MSALVSLPNSVWGCVPGSSASRAAELQAMDSQAELGNQNNVGSPDGAPRNPGILEFLNDIANPGFRCASSGLQMFILYRRVAKVCRIKCG